jgi:hypothetical protein
MVVFWVVTLRPVDGGGGGYASTRSLQNIKNKNADQPSKRMCDTVPHPCVASGEPPWLETVLFCGPDKGTFYAYAYVIFIHIRCIIGHYIRI